MYNILKKPLILYVCRTSMGEDVTEYIFENDDSDSEDVTSRISARTFPGEKLRVTQQS